MTSVLPQTGSGNESSLLQTEAIVDNSNGMKIKKKQLKCITKFRTVKGISMFQSQIKNNIS